jgi:ribosomal protein S18 acetylase RimI-like enzyme
MKFRNATVDDASEIAALVNSAYRGDSSRAGWTTEADLLEGIRTDTSEIASLIERPEMVIIMCLEGGELIGSVNVERRGADSYLGMLVVKPTLQNAGLGKKLIDAAENYAREHWSSKRMTMTVISVRSELIAYYERRGYRRTGEMKPFPFDEQHVPRVDGIELAILAKELN